MNEQELVNVYPFNLVADVYGKYSEELIDRVCIGGVKKAVASLNDKDREVVELRYKYGYTLKQCGEKIGVCGERARQILQHALHALRHSIRLKQMTFAMTNKECNEIAAKAVSYEKLCNSLADLVGFCRARSVDADKIIKSAFSMYDRFDSIKQIVANNTCGCEIMIEELGISNRAYDALFRSGIRSANDLVKLRTSDVLKIRNIGSKVYDEIIHAMHNQGYKFADE